MTAVQDLLHPNLASAKSDAAVVAVPSLSEEAAAEVPDVGSSGAYTLEEEKQKAKQDSLQAAAEAKKRGVREVRGSMQSVYAMTRSC
jgi:hypothetical protein